MIIYLSPESVEVLGKEDPASWMDHFALHRGYSPLGYSKVEISYFNCEENVYKRILNGLSMYTFSDYFSQEIIGHYHLRLTEDLFEVAKVMERKAAGG